MRIPNTFTVPNTYVMPRVELPNLGVGTMAWGDAKRGWGTSFNSTDLQEAFNICSESGIHFFDTSEVYGYQGGRLFESSEQLLSPLIATSPTTVLVSTKFMPVLWANVPGGKPPATRFPLPPL